MAEKGKTGAAANGQDHTGALPLFYTNPVPLDHRRHAGSSLRKNFGFSFAAGVNAVPVNLVELPQICSSYPVAFSPDDNGTPVAIVGLRDHENLFVNDKGEWDRDCYIPAYVRRYPFIFTEMPGSDKLGLCVDLRDGIVEEGSEQPFFAPDGSPSDLSKNALEFCKSYHSAALQTSEFGKALAASGILVDKQAEIGINEKTKISFAGFRVVDEQKFLALDDATFLDWRKKGWLPFVYAHLFSGLQWRRLSRLLEGRLRKDAA